MPKTPALKVRESLAKQAEILANIRRFFATRDVIEVDTCAISAFGATDPTVINMAVSDEAAIPLGFLQFSPEIAMKCLLAEGSGDIFQICRAFRAGEAGRIHRQEFRMLEWYRLGYDHHQLMIEVQQLIEPMVSGYNWDKISYAELFKAHVGIDPHHASSDLLYARAALSMDLEPTAIEDRSLLFDVIFSHQIQPKLNVDDAIFVYDFPREQAAYAQISDEHPYRSARFELLMGGTELANGYHEVVDPVEQAKRHAQEQTLRRRRGCSNVEFDPKLIAAMESGMPACAGVAIGLDRLMMVVLGLDSLDAVEMR